MRPVGPVEAARKQLARDLVAEVREVDGRLAKLSPRRCRGARRARQPAARGRRHRPGRGRPDCSAAPAGPAGSPPPSAFASYAGVAPVEVASGDRARHRLPRGGDRQLNLALHIAALTQVRMRASLGRAYYDRKIAEGKTHNEAMRCLKRRLADHVWRIMIADERGGGRRAREDTRGRL